MSSTYHAYIRYYMKSFKDNGLSLQFCPKEKEYVATTPKISLTRRWDREGYLVLYESNNIAVASMSFEKFPTNCGIKIGFYLSCLDSKFQQLFMYEVEEFLYYACCCGILLFSGRVNGAIKSHLDDTWTPATPGITNPVYGTHSIQIWYKDLTVNKDLNNTKTLDEWRPVI